jgi:uncharacterized protein YjbI with pentapeptide repeats
MTTPQRAPVRPRVLSSGGDTLLLEDEVRGLLEGGARGAVAVLGPAGAGKTMAVRHLAAVLGPHPRLALLDEPTEKEIDEVQPAGLVVYAAGELRLGAGHLATYRLAPWEPDDWIEYLLALHRPRCASVMARVKPADRLLLGVLPERWAAILDRLAADEALPDARRALHRYLGEFLSDTDLLERARSACLNALVAAGGGEAAGKRVQPADVGITCEKCGAPTTVRRGPRGPFLGCSTYPKCRATRPVPDDLAVALEKMARPGFGPALVRALRCPAAQTLLAAERVAADLHGDADCDYLARRLPRELVRAAGVLAAGDERGLEHLHRLLDGSPWSHAMAASLLHAVDSVWWPRKGSIDHLAGAYLDNAKWAIIDLPGVNLAGADLSQADLRGANLDKATLDGTDFTEAYLGEASLAGASAVGACLHRARMWKAHLEDLRGHGARLTEADLREAYAHAADFGGANLAGADLRNAILTQAVFTGVADLTGARLVGAVLAGADLRSVMLADADFSGADLAHANLTGLRLRGARWEGACFHNALMDQCDLEYLLLPRANFSDAHLTGALLTGTSMPGANLAGAVLREAGLAEVDWERADLRNADLRGASFHLGSTRSGLVGSPLACEGSRTGFYTDDYDEQAFKAPEEIRKANLCGADLRGANLDGVDFYLVDLRGARYDPDQAVHLRRSGAILEART